MENPSLDLIENVASGLRMTPAERSALHVLSRGQDPPMPPATPGGEWPEVGPGQRELIARLDAPAAITDETWTLVIRNKALTAWTDGWFEPGPPTQAEPRAVLVHARSNAANARITHLVCGFERTKTSAPFAVTRTIADIKALPALASAAPTCIA